MSLDEEFSREGLDQHCNIGGWVRASIDSRWQRSFGSKIRQVYSVLETLIGPADDGVLTAAQNAQHKLILDRNVQAAVVAEEQDVPNFSAGR
jgi:hypothetical protein